MLQYLHIENIAVIEQANIDFSEGFNVMTGETGAGKSIIIDSLFAILGERTSRELIRHECDRAVVSASFNDIGSVAKGKLEELGYIISDDEDLVLQRILFADGRGQVKINGQPANVSTLKEIGKYLINIHGQHDNQTLLSVDKHLSFIDAYAKNKNEFANYQNAFDNFRLISKELRRLTESEQEKSKRAELLKYQIDEIEKAEIRSGEVVWLKEQLNIGRQSEALLSAMAEGQAALSGSDDTEVYGALDLLRSALRTLTSAAATYEKLSPTVEALNSSLLEVEGIASELSSLAEAVEIDPDTLEKSRLRLDMIHDLMLKYGNTEDAILGFLDDARSELATIESDSERLAALEEKLKPAEQALIDAGAALSKTRISAASSICANICKELSFLDFNGARFEADVVQGKYTKSGCDSTEFLISANVGEIPKPLVKIASGGELSRIMLAIRSVLSLQEDVGTLIFDEIDSGISGHAAQKVGFKLSSVAKNRQVICVTHLAQIAAMADHHLLITKSVQDQKTFTKVEPLSHEGRVREIARIMSGGEYTDNLMKTAEEMLSLMKESKQ